VKTAIECLQNMGWKISEEDIKNGVQFAKKNTGLYGRWDIISYNPMIVLDVAHNADGLRMVLSQIKLLKFNNLHFILGLSADKDIISLLSQLPKKANYYFTQASIPRALNGKSLKIKASEFDLQGDVFENVNDAIENALAKSQSDDLVIVCGSIFVVSEVDRQRFLNN
jgi:dihydrofolate synthase/folylpolyglutamate synthase